MYSEKIIKRIEEEYRKFQGEMDFMNILRLYNPLIAKGNPYVQEGLIRRLTILCRCIRNIYRIMPIPTQERLPIGELEDLAINLQSFIFNIAGVLDNLAWVAVEEKNIDYGGEKKRRDVSLFKGPVYRSFSIKLQTKISSLENWYKTYLKAYRDALAHNIPLYIPSASLSIEDREQHDKLQHQLNNVYQNVYSGSIEKIEEIAKESHELHQQLNALGSLSMQMVYSSPKEPTTSMFFPAQILCDWMTVKEIALALAEELSLKVESIPQEFQLVEELKKECYKRIWEVN